jgi:hypothetical protein
MKTAKRISVLPYSYTHREAGSESYGSLQKKMAELQNFITCLLIFWRDL